MSEEVSKDQERFNYYADTEGKVSSGKGLTEETVRLISEDKDEPEWMLEKRLQALEIFFSRCRCLIGSDSDEDDAKQMIVNGFIEPLTEELPIEYAVELNRLIELEMEGSLG